MLARTQANRRWTRIYADNDSNREWIRLRQATRLSSPNVLRRDRRRIDTNKNRTIAAVGFVGSWLDEERAHLESSLLFFHGGGARLACEAVVSKADGRGRAAFNCALGCVKRQTSPIEP